MACVIFYGVGQNAQENMERWHKNGLQPVCFVDSAINKQHTFIDTPWGKLQTLPLFEALNKYPDYPLYLTQHSANLESVTAYLLALGIPNEKIKYCDYPNGIANINIKKKVESPPLEVDCEIGKNTYLGSPVRILDSRTKIGAFCSIAWDVNIGTTHHPQNWLTTHIFPYSRRPDLYDINVPNIRSFDYIQPCYVGNDVWIGCNVTIMDGITIGDGAIIGAGSIVTKDVPPYAIAVGNPARIKKFRFNDETINKLLRLKWWDLSDEMIASLPHDDIYECIIILEKIRTETTPI